MSLRATTCTLLCCLWGAVSTGEVREVTKAEVVEEFCRVMLGNEDHYREVIEACFPSESQDAAAREACGAVLNSVIRVMNTFREYVLSLPRAYSHEIFREGICVEANHAEDRINKLLINATRAGELLAIKALRVSVKAGDPVVPPGWTIKGEDRTD